MKTKAGNWAEVLATILAAGLMLIPAATQGQFHFVRVSARLSGPNGDSELPRAHVGDRADVYIEVFNLDTCFDTMEVTSAVVTVRHASGDVTTPNLSPRGIVLLPFADFADLSTSFIVEPNDTGFLSVEYEVHGTDNWDGFCGSGAPVSFMSFSGDHLQILKPALDIVQQCDVSPAYPHIVFSGFVTNTGDTPLSDIVVVSDMGTPGNTTDDSTIQIGTLNPNGAASYTGAYTATGPSANTVTVRGTDALGLTVNDSSTRTVPVALRITRSGTDAVRISRPSWAEGFRLESTTGVDQSWSAVTNAPTIGEGEVFVTLRVSATQFYRLAQP